MYLKLAYKMYHLFDYTISWYSVSSPPPPSGRQGEELRIAVARNTQLGFV